MPPSSAKKIRKTIKAVKPIDALQTVSILVIGIAIAAALVYLTLRKLIFLGRASADGFRLWTG